MSGVDVPLVRIMDAAVYFRTHAPGFLWGVYEQDPQFFDADGIPGGVAEMPLDDAVLGGRIPPDDDLRRDAAWQYRHFYGAV